jgi:hypothetical protein
MEDPNQLQFELLTLRKAVDELQGSGLRSVARTFGAVLILAGFLMVIFRWMSDAQMSRFERDWGSRLQHDNALADEKDVDAPRAAMRAAQAAMKAAEQCKEKIVIKYLPTLNMYYPNPKVRPLLGAYVLGNMFNAASPHPTTPQPSSSDIVDPNTANQVTWKGLKKAPAV